MQDKAFYEKLSLIPKKSGCYIWKNKFGEVIYIGKAKNLFNRTHQYFQKKNNLKTKNLVKEIYDFEYFIVNTEIESLILENNLIKKYKPKFNILLKESSGYPYIVLTDERFPRILYTRDNNKYKGKYFGPLPSIDSKAYDVYKILNQIFPFRKCYKIRNKKCIFADIHQCLAPCVNYNCEYEYKELSANFINFLKGKDSLILNNILSKEKEMANQMNFEKANEYKKIINDIKYIREKQIVQLYTEQNYDFIAFSLNETHIVISIFNYNSGNLLTKNQNIYEIYDYEIEDQIINFLNQYYLDNYNKPNCIYISLSSKNINILSIILNIKVIKPKCGKYFDILNIVYKNANEYLKINTTIYKQKINRETSAINQLNDIVKINNISQINVFDISNIFNENKVGAMISLTNYKYNYKEFRKFSIEDNVSGDYNCMFDVISRFISKQINISLPNLIIVDGGSLQISAAEKALNNYNLKAIIPILGLVKSDNHKLEYLIFNNKKIYLDANSSLYLFLVNLQEKVHNYAISFFRDKKFNSFFNNSLENIPGLGKKRLDLLLKNFGSYINILNSSVDELSQFVPRIIATKIKEKK